MRLFPDPLDVPGITPIQQFTAEIKWCTSFMCNIASSRTRSLSSVITRALCKYLHKQSCILLFYQFCFFLISQVLSYRCLCFVLFYGFPDLLLGKYVYKQPMTLNFLSKVCQYLIWHFWKIRFTYSSLIWPHNYITETVVFLELYYAAGTVSIKQINKHVCHLRWDT